MSPPDIVIRLREHGNTATPEGWGRHMSCSTGWGEARTLVKYVRRARPPLLAAERDRHDGAAADVEAADRGDGLDLRDDQ